MTRVISFGWVPVYYILNADSKSLYNIPGPEIDFKVWASGKTIPDPHEILVLPPVLDTISITIHGNEAVAFATPSVPLKHKKATSKEFWDAVSKLLAGVVGTNEFPEISNFKPRTNVYRINLIFTLKTVAAKIKVSAWPYNSDVAPLRIEFSANNVGDQGLEEFVTLWDKIVYDNMPFRALLSDANVTRADVAIDVVNLSVADFTIAHKNKLVHIWTASTPETGSQTQIFHIKTAKNEGKTFSFKKRGKLQIYDKRQQFINAGIEPLYGDNEHTRIEASCASNSKFKNLAKAKNPFAGFTFRRPTLLEEPYKSGVWRMFYDAVKARGYEEAVSLLPVEFQNSQLLNSSEFTNNSLLNDSDWELWKKTIEEGPISKWVKWSNTPLEILVPEIKDNLGLNS